MSAMTDKPLLDMIREASWHRHEKFENLPFVKALVAGTLPLESYLGQLRGLAIIIGTLEKALSDAESPLLSSIFPLLKSRYSMLCNDLRFFAPGFIKDILPAVKSALKISRMIREAAVDKPSQLAGYLYVLEGTTRGNQVHLPDIRRCFDLRGESGVEFYTGYGPETESHWEAFRQVMNGSHEEADSSVMLQAVHIMYDGLEQFHGLLYPLPADELGMTATALNPEAGDHPVPQDPAILKAALRAGERCWEEFSYYNRRYGARGRRFTDSDVAWLAALADQPESVILDQILWLGRLLAVRGMPRLLLERQVSLLAKELEPLGGSIQTSSLHAALKALEQERNQLLKPSSFANCCTIISEMFPGISAQFTDLPTIIAAAFADELAGIPECLLSLTDWLEESGTLSRQDARRMEDALSVCRSSLYKQL